MNKVILIGRFTADPELRQTTSGIASCRFTVAVNRKFKNDAGEYEADFISCVAWRQTAEFICRYFKKGQMITIEGNLRTSTYTDKKHSDVTHYATDVYVDSVEFCGSKNENTAVNTSSVTTQQSTVQQEPEPAIGSLDEFEEIISDGEVPF